MLVGIKDIRSAIIASIFITICYGCANDSSSESSIDPTNNTGSIDYVELALTNQTEKLSSIEYSKSTTHKCKYLQNGVYSFDFRNVDGISPHFNESSGEGFQKYHKAKFTDIKIYFPLKNILINGSTITAQIYQTLDYSEYSDNDDHTILTASDTCYTVPVGGILFHPPDSKGHPRDCLEWIHFPEFPKDNCYAPFPATIDVTITNYQSDSCKINFKVHNS